MDLFYNLLYTAWGNVSFILKMKFKKKIQTKHFGYDRLINELFGEFYSWNPCSDDWQLLHFLGHFPVELQNKTLQDLLCFC